MELKQSSSILALVMLLTACVTETSLPSVVPTPSTVVGEQPVIKDDVAVQRFAPIFCVNRKTFEKAVRNERLIFYGVIPTAAKIIVEIYSAKSGESGFTIAVRDATLDEVCIMIAGSELVPVAWSTVQQ